MLGNSHFYNRTMRKVIVAFGSMFNDIVLQRYTADGVTAKEHFKVPLSYGAKEKYITRITSDPNLTKAVQSVVPRISFELSGLDYDTTRKQLSSVMNFAANTATSNNLRTQYVPVPYNFQFNMSLYVRNTEDGTQILEQILPFFTPDFTVTVDFISGMEQKYDMPVVLTSVTPSIDYEGDMTTTRLIIWDLTFTAKGYIWPPVKEGKIIRQANTNLYIETATKTSQKVFINDWANNHSNVTTGKSNYFIDEETIFATKTTDGKNIDVKGDMAYFSNSNTVIVIIRNLNTLLKANDIIEGVTSHASYTVKSVDKEPLRTVIITTTPDPATANAEDEYGFSETITEWPLT